MCGKWTLFINLKINPDKAEIKWTAEDEDKTIDIVEAKYVMLSHRLDNT